MLKIKRQNPVFVPYTKTPISKKDISQKQKTSKQKGPDTQTDYAKRVNLRNRAFEPLTE